MAILYRRKEDDSLVILKEINLYELSSSERQLALNEVSLLSRLDHPHIISYYDSFEEDGSLMVNNYFLLFFNFFRLKWNMLMEGMFYILNNTN